MPLKRAASRPSPPGFRNLSRGGAAPLKRLPTRWSDPYQPGLPRRLASGFEVEFLLLQKVRPMSLSQRLDAARVPLRAMRCSGCGNRHGAHSLSMLPVVGRWLCLGCSGRLAPRDVTLKRVVELAVAERRDLLKSIADAEAIASG